MPYIRPFPAYPTTRTPLLNYSVSHGTVTVKVDGVVVNKLSGDTLGPFADGPHTIKVEAVNDAGLTGFAEVTYTVQSLPLITINTVTTPTNLSSQTISGSRSLDGTVSVAINTTASASIVTYPTPTTWSCAISNLAQAANDITVTVTAPDNQTNTAVTSISYYVLSLSNVTVSANTINTFASESATIFFHTERTSYGHVKDDPGEEWFVRNADLSNIENNKSSRSQLFHMGRKG